MTFTLRQSSPARVFSLRFCACFRRVLFCAGAGSSGVASTYSSEPMYSKARSSDIFNGAAEGDAFAIALRTHVGLGVWLCRGSRECRFHARSGPRSYSGVIGIARFHHQIVACFPAPRSARKVSGLAAFPCLRANHSFGPRSRRDPDHIRGRYGSSRRCRCVWHQVGFKTNQPTGRNHGFDAHVVAVIVHVGDFALCDSGPDFASRRPSRFLGISR